MEVLLFVSVSQSPPRRQASPVNKQASYDVAGVAAKSITKKAESAFGAGRRAGGKTATAGRAGRLLDLGVVYLAGKGAIVVNQTGGALMITFHRRHDR